MLPEGYDAVGRMEQNNSAAVQVVVAGLDVVL